MQPELELDQIAPELISTGAKAIVNNAKRLGLTWTLTLATVTSSDPVEAIVDGDTVAVGMVSMIGQTVAGQRVYVLQVPPSGNFIVGYSTTTPSRAECRVRRAATQGINNVTVSPFLFDTSDVQIGGDYITVSPASSTITVPIDGLWAISYRISFTVGGGVRNFQSINVTTTVTGMPATWRSFLGSGEAINTLTIVIPFNVGDTFTCDMFQSSGGLVLATADLIMNYLGPAE